MLSTFQVVPLQERKHLVGNSIVEAEQIGEVPNEQTPSLNNPKFGERPDVDEEYNFQDEIVWLLF